MFRDNARLTGHSHEIGIPEPSRHHVYVQMFFKARSGGTPDVYPDIYTFYTEFFLLHGNHDLYKAHHIEGFFVAEIFHEACVADRHDHDMAVGVRKTVHNDESLAESAQNKGPIIGAAVEAKKTLFVARFLRRRDVFHSPGCPNSIHINSS